MITEQTFDIPCYLNDFCAERNAPYEWLNRPFVFESKHKYACATDGKGLIAYKLPVENIPTKSAYLLEPNSHQDLIRGYIEFDKSNGHLYSIPSLQNCITTKNFECKLCNEDNKVDCNKCSGTTEIECGACTGQGSHPCITCRKPDLCKRCDGEGVIECGYCVNGKKDCICQEASDFVTFVAGDNRAQIDLRILKKFIRRLDTNSYIRVHSHGLQIWNDHLSITLMGVLDSKKQFPEINLKQFQC